MPPESLDERRQGLTPAQKEILAQRLRGSSGGTGPPPISPHPERLLGPLSFTQQRMWFVQKLAPDSNVYNTPLSIHLKGPCNPAALNNAVNLLITRHAVLRSVFPLQNGQPMQKIQDESIVTLHAEDLSSLEEGSRQRMLIERQQALLQQPFDLEQGPLLRGVIWRLCPQEYVLFLVIHHIIYDGWSRHILLEELAACYQAALHHTPLDRLPLPVQFLDFAVWQQEQWQAGRYQTELEYWVKTLRDAPPALHLPLYRPSLDEKATSPERSKLSLGAPLVKAMEDLGSQNQTTLFMTLLSGWALLLKRLSGQEDLVIGSPVAGRTLAETQPLIGPFINSLALRLDLPSKLTFHDLLQHVRSVCLEAYAHQELPFEKLVEAINPHRSLDHTPIFQVLINMNYPYTHLEVEGLVMELVQPPPSAANFDLTLYAYPDGSGKDLHLELVYASSRLVDGSGDIILQQLHKLLEQVVHQPNFPLDQFSLVTSETATLLPDLSAPIPEPYFPPVTELFCQQASLHSHQIAIHQGDSNWSYGQLEQASAKIAQQLIADGIQPHEVTAITGDQTFEMIAAILGVLRAGGVLLLLERTQPQRRQQAMLEAAGCSRVLVNGELEVGQENLAAGRSLRRISLQEADLIGEIQLPKIAPEDPAYIFFTSGTTGTPKGILGWHKGLGHFIHWEQSEVQAGPGDRIPQLTSLTFDPILRNIFLSLAYGGTLCIPPLSLETYLPRSVLGWLRKEKVTILHTVPSLAQTWINEADQDTSLPELRYLCMSGEPLRAELVQQWQRVFPGKVLNFYGPTETTMIKSCAHLPRPPQPGIQPIGRAITNSQVFIVNHRSQPCGVGEIGQIVIRTPFRTLGYLQPTQPSNTYFTPNPHRQDDQDWIYWSGDLGFLRPDGELEIIGRLDDQVKIHGVRIEPDEVASHLASHPDVHQAAVLARPDPQGEMRLVAYVQANEGLILHEMRSYLSQYLPEASIPPFLVKLTELPLTPHGKLDRAALPEPSWVIQHPMDQTPHTPLQEQLLLIWQQVLGQASLTIHDDFFAAGGYSFLTMRLVAEIETQLGYKLPFSVVFQYPTVERMALWIDQPKRNSADGTLVILANGGNLPPFFLLAPVTGNLVNYRHLVKYWSEESARPVYGIEARGLDGRLPPFKTIPEIAADVVRQMRSVQPQGPYFLGGFSFGGLLAYETASLLIEQKQKVGMLIILDTNLARAGRFISSLSPMQKLVFFSGIWVHRLGYLLKTLFSFNLKGQLRFIRDKLIGLPALTFLDTVPRRRNLNTIGETAQKVEMANIRAADQYQPGRFTGPLVLLRCDRQFSKYYDPPALYWDWIASGVKIIPAPGTHNTLLDETNSIRVASILETCLQELHSKA